MKLQDLPKLGGQLDGGILAGLTTKTDGTHCAVVLLPGKGYDLNWSDAKAWATAQGGELPSRPVAARLNAQAVPDGWKLVPVDALKRWRDAFAEELSAWDIDPPLHHVHTSHDEIEAVLSAAPAAPQPAQQLSSHEHNEVG